MPETHNLSIIPTGTYRFSILYYYIQNNIYYLAFVPGINSYSVIYPNLFLRAFINVIIVAWYFYNQTFS